MQVVRFGNSGEALISGHADAEGDSQAIGDRLIGVSRWTQTARQLVVMHAAHDDAIILEGGRGAGKALLARLIHRFSARHRGPFVSLSLVSTTDEAARAVLFGATRGQVSDLAASDKGLVELAKEGTLYLDGLSEMSSALTDDIVRLANRRGLSYEGDSSVRILLGWPDQSGLSHPSATIDTRSADLDYERIHIPPLRERPDDIEALAEHFIKECCSQTGREMRKISPEAMKILRRYDWPRNVGELRMVVYQLVKHLTPPEIDVPLLPAYLAGSSAGTSELPSSGLDLDNEVKRVEVDLICAALKQSRGLQNRAAQLLRIKPTTLFMKIRRHGIDVGAFR